VADKLSEPANILVIVPYLFAFVTQAANGIVAGVFSFEALAGWAPMVLGAVTMGLAAIATLVRYLQLR